MAGAVHWGAVEVGGSDPFVSAEADSDGQDFGGFLAASVHNLVNKRVPDVGDQPTSLHALSVLSNRLVPGDRWGTVRLAQFCLLDKSYINV